MSIKRFTLVLALFALLTAGVSAHDDWGLPGPKPMRGLGLPLEEGILLEATGLDAEVLRAALAEGATLAELIEANEGNVAAVIADVVARMTEAINTNAIEIVEGLDELVTEDLNASHSRRGPWGRRWIRHPRLFGYAGVGDAILEATGLDAGGLRAALAEGSTFAELIKANDGSVTDVSAEIVTHITDAVNAAAAERIESLHESLGELFDSDLSDRWRRGRRGRMRPRFFFGYWGEYGVPAVEEPAA